MADRVRVMFSMVVDTSILEANGMTSETGRTGRDSIRRITGHYQAEHGDIHYMLEDLESNLTAPVRDHGEWVFRDDPSQTPLGKLINNAIN